MPKYYYHPLGNLAKAFSDGSASDSEWPHTYDANESGKPHGVNDLDWGSGNSIPAHSPVYSMTDGTIYKIFTNHNAGGRGFAVYIKTDRLDSANKPICIQYIELSGLSDKLAETVGCTKGPLSLEEYASVDVGTTTPIDIKMGEQIGYTNDWYSNYSNFHTTFVYEEQGNNDDSDIGPYLENSPHVTQDTLNSEFTLEQNNTGSKAEYIVKCNGKLVGRDNGMVRLQNGASQYYPVYPFISYLVCQQSPQYLSGSVNKEGAVSIGTIEEVIDRDVILEEVVKCYKKDTFGNNWMGKRPTTLEELNSSQGIRNAAAVCKAEFNFAIYGVGEFPCLSYAKLIRAIMIGTSHSGDNMKEWFENLNDSIFDVRSGWRTRTFDTEEDLHFAQLVYDNIKYPDIYGIEEFQGSEQLKEKVIYACRQVPMYNMFPWSDWGLPLSFLVNYDVKNDIDEQRTTGGSGNYLLYRLKEGHAAKYNPKVLK